MRDYKKYNVWIIGHEVTMDIYKQTQSFPADEKFGITNEMRRASSSIPANIAEGCGRETDTEFRSFLMILQGSASELAYFTILAKDLKYIKNDDFLIIHDKVNKIKRSLNNLIQKL